MIQNQWRSGNCIGEKDLVIDHHLDQTGTFLIDKLCHLQGKVLLDHKDMVAVVLFQQEGPGTYMVLVHLDMEVAQVDMEVAQVVHLHRKHIVVAVLFHQEDLVPQHLCTIPQLTNSIEQWQSSLRKI